MVLPLLGDTALDREGQNVSGGAGWVEGIASMLACRCDVCSLCLYARVPGAAPQLPTAALSLRRFAMGTCKCESGMGTVKFREREAALELELEGE